MSSATMQWQPYRYAPTPVNGDGRLSTREIIVYSMLGLAVSGSAYFLIRRAIIKGRANSEQNKTMTEGNAATYAKRIKMAFENDGWWGTDKDELRQAVRDVPNKSEFRKVMASYHRMYNRNLLADMQSELKSTEYNEMLAIISVKPETGTAIAGQATTAQLAAWAQRLKAAFDITYGIFPGTDEAAIKAVFIEIPTQAAFKQVGIVYQRLYGNDLTKDLKSELEFWEYDPMMQIILSKPIN